MWRTGQVWRVVKTIGVWREKSLDWLELVARGRALILQQGTTLLVIEDTEILMKDGHTYTSVLCLELGYGELVYVIANVASGIGDEYQRLV